MAERHVLQFDRGSSRFLYRAAGVILRGEEVLLQQFAGTDFWCFPGGRIEFGETGVVAAERELREEVEPDVQVQRLLWVIENFFEYQGLDYHEVGLYVLAAVDPSGHVHNAREPWTATEDDGKTEMTFVWHPIGSLKDLFVVPKCLAGRLRELPQTVEYLVNRADFV